MIKKNTEEQNIESSSNSIKFTPDAELLAFATSFSENYKNHSEGQYLSDGGNYSINYYDANLTSNTILSDIKWFARVDRISGLMEFNKTQCLNEKITPDFVFYLILWCKAMNEYHIVKMADQLTIEYYLTTGRSKKELLLGNLYMLETSYNQFNKERCFEIEQLIIKLGDEKN